MANIPVPKSVGKEDDLLLPPHIIPRPRYELVLTGDQDRFQIEQENNSGYTLNWETAWRLIHQAMIATIVIAVCVGIVLWGYKTEKHRREANQNPH